MQKDFVPSCEYSNDNTKRVEIQVSKDYAPEDKSVVRAIIQGEKFAETLYLKNKPSKKGTIRKINEETYEVISTGEIKEYEYKDTRNIQALIRTFARLKGLIRTNFDGGENQLFVTLTYKYIKPIDALYGDFEKFMKRLKYAYSNHKFDYVTVVEPNRGDRWHFHMLLKSDQPILYIDNKDMEQIWRNGMTETVRLISDDIGQYYTSYFTDLIIDAETNKELSQADELAGKMPSCKKKVKGGRLHRYPPNFKFYRCSRGIEEPKEIETEWREMVEVYGKPLYHVTYDIREIDMETGEYKDLQRIHKATFRRIGSRKEEERFSKKQKNKKTKVDKNK